MTDITTEEAVRTWQDIVLPGEDILPRKFAKDQRLAATPRENPEPRVFSISGPKADICVRMLLDGSYSRKAISNEAGCSVSRVAEVAWGMQAAGLLNAKGEVTYEVTYVELEDESDEELVSNEG